MFDCTSIYNCRLLLVRFEIILFPLLVSWKVPSSLQHKFTSRYSCSLSGLSNTLTGNTPQPDTAILLVFPNRLAKSLDDDHRLGCVRESGDYYLTPHFRAGQPWISCLTRAGDRGSGFYHTLFLPSTQRASIHHLRDSNTQPHGCLLLGLCVSLTHSVIF